MALHFEALPPNTMQHLTLEFRLRICRRLTPLQLSQTEKYLSNDDRILLWKRLGRKLKIKTSLTGHRSSGSNPYRVTVLTKCFELLVGRKNKIGPAQEDDNTCRKEWMTSVQKLAPMVPTFSLRNPTIQLKDLIVLLSHLKSCHVLDLARSFSGSNKKTLDGIVNVLKHRHIHGLDLSECGMTAQSLRYLCMQTVASTASTANSSRSNNVHVSSCFSTRLARVDLKTMNNTTLRSPRCSPHCSPIRPSLPDRPPTTKWNMIATQKHSSCTATVVSRSFAPAFSPRSRRLVDPTAGLLPQPLPSSTSHGFALSPKKSFYINNSHRSSHKTKNDKKSNGHNRNNTGRNFNRNNHTSNNHTSNNHTSNNNMPSLYLKLNKNPSLGSSCSLTTQYLLKRSINTTLVTLSFASNPRIKEEGAKILSEWMRGGGKGCSLTSLDMSGCDLDAIGIRHLLQTVPVCPLLNNLNVSNNIVDGRRSNYSISEALHTALWDNASLTAFNIADNALWESELNTIFTMFQSQSTALTLLNMQRTNINQGRVTGGNSSSSSSSSSSNGRVSGPSGISLLLDSLSMAPQCSLSSLNVARNDLSAQDISMFFCSVVGQQYVHRLTSLTLDGNMINDQVAQTCGTFLTSATCVLKTLKMRRYESQNQQQRREQILMKNNALAFVGGNNANKENNPEEYAITCFGFIALLNGARTTTASLTSLDVSGHCIRNTGCIHLSEVLFETKLKYLNVSHNRIGDRGVTPLALQLEKYRKDSTLSSSMLAGGGGGIVIELVGNPISKEIASLVV